MVSLAGRLLEELLKLTLRPRPPHGYLWARPALSVLEYSQHLCQAVPLSLRADKAGATAAGGAAAEGALPLLQLPHVDEDVAKALGRRKVRSLAELLVLEPAERQAALKEAKVPEAAVADVVVHLGGMPALSMAARCEGEAPGSALIEGELGVCHCTLSLEREAGGEGACSPFAPGGKSEAWYLLLVDPASNWALSALKVDLHAQPGLARFRAAQKKAARAEQQQAQGDKGSSGDLVATDGAPSGAGKTGEAGVQQFQLIFRTPPAGAHNLVAMCVSDYWVGCDARCPLKLKVGKPSSSR